MMSYDPRAGPHRSGPALHYQPTSWGFPPGGWSPSVVASGNDPAAALQGASQQAQAGMQQLPADICVGWSGAQQVAQPRSRGAFRRHTDGAYSRRSPKWAYRRAVHRIRRVQMGKAAHRQGYGRRAAPPVGSAAKSRSVHVRRHGTWLYESSFNECTNDWY